MTDGITLSERLWAECTPERMAASATRVWFHHEIWVIQVQWEKDFPGQVTDGRIGAPRLVMGPLSWIGKERRDAVLSIIGRTPENAPDHHLTSIRSALTEPARPRVILPGPPGAGPEQPERMTND